MPEKSSFFNQIARTELVKKGAERREIMM